MLSPYTHISTDIDRTLLTVSTGFSRTKHLRTLADSDLGIMAGLSRQRLNPLIPFGTTIEIEHVGLTVPIPRPDNISVAGITLFVLSRKRTVPSIAALAHGANRTGHARAFAFVLVGLSLSFPGIRYSSVDRAVVTCGLMTRYRSASHSHASTLVPPHALSVPGMVYWVPRHIAELTQSVASSPLSLSSRDTLCRS
eukprot:3766711-Rhodomonas_salina.3